MNPQIQQQISALLTKMGDVAPNAWQILLQQQINSAHAWQILSLIGLAISLFLLFVGIVFAFSDHDNGGAILFCILMGIIFIGFTFSLIVNSLVLENPAYYAMRDFVLTLKP